MATALAVASIAPRSVSRPRGLRAPRVAVQRLGQVQQAAARTLAQPVVGAGSGPGSPCGPDIVAAPSGELRCARLDRGSTGRRRNSRPAPPAPRPAATGGRPTCGWPRTRTSGSAGSARRKRRRVAAGSGPAGGADGAGACPGGGRFRCHESHAPLNSSRSSRTGDIGPYAAKLAAGLPNLIGAQRPPEERRHELARTHLIRSAGSDLAAAKRWAYDICHRSVRASFPIDFCLATLARWLFRTLGPLTGPHRSPSATCDRLSELPRRRDHATPRDAMEELGRSFAEFPILDRIIADPAGSRSSAASACWAIIAAGPARWCSFRGTSRTSRSMPAAIVQAGVDCQITYRAPRTTPMSTPACAAAASAMASACSRPRAGRRARVDAGAGAGESVALMNDQKFNGGVAAPAVRRAGPSPRRGRRAGASLRHPAAADVRAAAEEGAVPGRRRTPIHLEDTGDRNADIEAGVRRINAFIEDRIRARPAEWFWVHRRWPKEVYRRRAAVVTCPARQRFAPEPRSTPGETRGEIPCASPVICCGFCA